MSNERDRLIYLHIKEHGPTRTGIFLSREVKGIDGSDSEILNSLWYLCDLQILDWAMPDHTSIDWATTDGSNSLEAHKVWSLSAMSKTYEVILCGDDS